MLVKNIPAVTGWDERRNEFVTSPAVTLVMEHSLISLSKWESKWKKPFLTNKTKTDAELRDYIRCMVISPNNVDDNVFLMMSPSAMQEVYNYVNESQTATTIRKNGNQKKSSEIPTSELIYYWMITNGIPMQCEKWHLSRLLTLIEVCNVKSEKPKKMSQKELYNRNAAINARNKAKYHTKG